MYLNRIDYINWSNLIPVIQLLSHGSSQLKLSDKDKAGFNLKQCERQITEKNSRNPYLLYTPRCGLCFGKQLTDLFGENACVLKEHLQSGPVWIDIRRATQSDCRILVRSFRMHPMLVDDLLAPSAIRAEGSGFVHGQIVLTFEAVPLRFLQDRTVFTADNVSDSHGTLITCLLTPAFLFTVHEAQFPSLSPVLSRLYGGHLTGLVLKNLSNRSSMSDPLESNTLYLVFLLLQAQFELVLGATARLNTRVNAIGERVFQRTNVQTRNSYETFLQEISLLRSLTTAMQKYLTKKRTLIRDFARKCCATEPHKAASLSRQSSFQPISPLESDTNFNESQFDWIILHWKEVEYQFINLSHRIDNELASLEQADDLLDRNYSAYMAVLTFDMTTSNKRINDMLSHITKFTGLFGPVAFATALFGFNTTVPLQSVAQLYPFYCIIGAAGLLTWATFIFMYES